MKSAKAGWRRNNLDRVPPYGFAWQAMHSRLLVRLVTAAASLIIHASIPFRPVMTNALQAFIDRVKAGEPVEFQDTIAVIAAHFDYSPRRFTNGFGDSQMVNEPGANEGSCKIFSLARQQGLTEAQTLALFGDFYRQVLEHPEGADHQNIRQFMRSGWAGIHFDGEALRLRTAE